MDNFFTVGKDGDFQEGQVRRLAVDGEDIALVRRGQEILAFQDLCTHDDGPLAEGTLEGDAIECPRHGARFSIRTGEVLAMPASHPIKTYPVKVEAGEVKVRLSR